LASAWAINEICQQALADSAFEVYNDLVKAVVSIKNHSDPRIRTYADRIEQAAAALAIRRRIAMIEKVTNRAKNKPDKWQRNY
jgi:hypothetical protein